MDRMLTLLLLSALASLSFSMPDSLTASFKDDSMKNRIVKHYEREMTINGSPEEVFAFMDDIRNTGKHMTESSGAMAGSKLKIEWLSENKTGLGTKVQMDGEGYRNENGFYR